MEAFPWAPRSPRRARAPGPAPPPAFSSWRDYLGLATLVTKAERAPRSPSPCCSALAGPGPGPRGDDQADEDDAGGDGPDPRGRPLEPRGRPAELSPFPRRAAAAIPGPAPAWAPEPRLHGPAAAAASGQAARLPKPEPQVCVFCRNNREAVALYSTHVLKGPDGRVLCPVLRRYTCPLCGASGDNAHTIKYCPLSKPPPPPPPRSARDGPAAKKLLR